MSLGELIGKTAIAVEIIAVAMLVIGMDQLLVLFVAVFGPVGVFVLYGLYLLLEPKDMKDKREKYEKEERQNQEHSRLRKMLGPDFVETKPGTFERIVRK